MDSKNKQNTHNKRPSQRGDASDTPSKNIHINIHVGSLPKFLSKKTIMRGLKAAFATRRRVIFGCIAVVIGGIVMVSAITHRRDGTKQVANDSLQSNKIIENIEYQTVLPEGRSISALGGWKRISPPGKAAVYAYTDAINGIAISVSQQPLPATFKDDVEGEVANLAKKFDANDKLTAGNTKVYLGTSAKGPQSLIFSKNGLLVLMKSQSEIDNSAWIDYIQSLN